MNIKQESICIVIVGAWNSAIFRSPDWLANNLELLKDEPIEIALPLNDPAFTTRLKFKDNLIFVNNSSLKVVSTNEDPKEGLQEILDLLAKLLGLLPHTPLHQCGINISFETDYNSTKIDSLMEFSDKDTFAYLVENTLIKRSFALDKDLMLNFTIQKKGDNTEFEFNFHYTRFNISVLNEIISKKNADKHYALSLESLKDAYNLSID